MDKNYLKLTEETRQEFVSLFTAKQMQNFIEITKAQKDVDSGTFKVIVSSDDEDRQGEKVNQDGLDFKNYMENPVVLWGHDYYSPPIGVTTRIWREGNKTMAEGKFAPTPFAQTIRALYDFGAVNTVSIGFIPRSFDDAGNTLTAEVLEYSFVDIPANARATAQRSIPMAYAKSHHLNPDLLKMKGLDFAIAEDFTADTKKAMSELVASLIKHVPADQEADKVKYAELAAKYVKAGKTAPTYEEALVLSNLVEKSPCKAYFEAGKAKFEIDIKGAEAGADCQLDDGTPGVMAPDPDDDAGGLICVPVENAGQKAAGDEDDTEKPGGKVDGATGDGDHDVNYEEAADELDKSISAEVVDKHPKKMAKAIDEFHKGIQEGTQLPEDDKGEKVFKPMPADDAKKLKDDMAEAHSDEMDRHQKKVGKAIDQFTKSVTAKALKAKKPEPTEAETAMRKDIDEEHSLHEAKCQKAIDEYTTKMVDPEKTAKPEDQDLHKAKCMKALSDEHDRHFKSITKAIDEYKDESQEPEDGEGKKTVKAGAALSKANRALVNSAMDATAKAIDIHKGIAEMHSEQADHLKSAHAALKALHDGGEEGTETPEDGETTPSKTQRSDPSGVVPKDVPTLDAFLQGQQLLKSQATAIGNVLEKMNKIAKTVTPRSRK